MLFSAFAGWLPISGEPIGTSGTPFRWLEWTCADRAMSPTRLG